VGTLLITCCVKLIFKNKFLYLIINVQSIQLIPINNISGPLFIASSDKQPAG